MFAELLLATAFQVGPFYQQAPESDYAALRPFWSRQGEVTDVLWPLFTAHRDWWRFGLFAHYQEGKGDDYQFDVLPLWFNGRDRNGESFAGLFPIYGRHPHLALLYDFEFCLWPLWMRYRMPRPSENRWMTSNAVLFPFVSWRDDGSWGVWPLCGVGHNRESDHRYVLWPLFTWADYREDRDTGGAGRSWMFWPFYASVERERESQWMVLPPLISTVRTKDGWRGRWPWPFVNIERRTTQSRTCVFPFYEESVDYRFRDGSVSSRVTRFLWKFIEIYPDETRVFPFYARQERQDGPGSEPVGYLRLWPFWESARKGEVTRSRLLAPIPIRWADAVDRNWAKFWTFYEREADPICTYHSLLWGLVRWRTFND